MIEHVNNLKLWELIAAETEVDRHIVKEVVYAMLFGANIIACAIRHGLEIEDIVSIRMEFNEFTRKAKAKARND